jgi:chromosome segregation ATPase
LAGLKREYENIEKERQNAFEQIRQLKVQHGAALDQQRQLLGDNEKLDKEISNQKKQINQKLNEKNGFIQQIQEIGKKIVTAVNFIRNVG